MICFGTPSRRATLDLERVEASEAEFTELFATYEVGEKDGPAIIPAIFRPCSTPCRNHERETSVDCGGGELHRLKDNVAAVTAFGADLDDVPEADFVRALEGLIAKGLKFWAWQTHSHVEGSGKVRARILIPFDRPLEIVSAKQWSNGAWPNLAKWLGLDGAASADHACRDPSRIYYLPRKPSGESQHESVFIPGQALNWGAVLGDSLSGFSAPAALAPAAPDEDPSRPVDLEDFRDRLKAIGKKETRALVARALAGEALTAPPEKRQPGQPSRYIAWRQLTGALAAKAEDWESSAALLSVVRDAHTAEAKESPHDFTEWETIEHLFETARAGIPQLRAEWEAQRAADERMILKIGREHGERIAKDLEGRVSEVPAVSAAPSVPVSPASSSREPEGEEVPEGDPKEGDPDFDWTEGLQLKKQEEGPPKVESCPSNVEHVLRNHPAWKGTLRFNEFSREIELHGGPLGTPGKVITLKDNHAGKVADWLSRDIFLNMRIKDHVVWSRILIVAEANAYDPLKDYLNGLKWDGTERISAAPAKYFGAPSVDDLGRDISGYLASTFQKWMISAAARGLVPGCKVDTVLHFEGRQGVGKSSALKVLGGEFYSETAIDIHSKDSWAACASNWIIELGELDTFRRAEVSAQKRFFALHEDQYRPPYGRSAVKAARRCVFVGTTNTDDYLTDPTGNRRHWPIKVEKIDLEALRADRDQLWAEAVHKFRAGAKWYLDEAESAEQERQAELRTAGDGVAEAVLAWWLKEKKRPTEITTHVICRDVLDEPPSRGMETRIGHALRALGFQSKRKEISGRTFRFYVPTPELLERKPSEPATATQMIAQAKGITPLTLPIH